MTILISNTQDREEEARRQDDIDMAFERSLERKLNTLVSVITDDFAELYATTGNIVDTSNYNNELEALLIQSYRKTNTEFSMTYLDNLVEQRMKAKTQDRKKRLDKVIEIRNEVEPIIIASLLAWSQTQAPQESEIITTTWQKIINKNVDNTMADSIINNESMEDRAIAAKAKKPMNDELVTHNGVVATQEVQTATENAKFVEADETNKSLKANQVITERIEKMWVNVGANVRDAHKAANGQRRDLDDAFLVGGELLKYPKDSSLGASLKNLINCKCKAIFM